MESLSEKIFDYLAKIPKSFYLPIGIAVAGLIFLGIGLMQLSSSTTVPAAAPVSAGNNIQSSTSANIQFGQIQVDVEGAVLHPGVYQLSSDARVQDALIAAGGMSQDADRDAVAKNLNLAAKLLDGAKLYIPKIGDQTAVTTNQSSDSQTNVVNINTASESDLDGLPGIGPVTAQKIINARPFSSVNDLLTKKVVSQSVFTKIQSLVTVY